jgi:ubiquinone biosynthesis monooxygenase Coq7
MTNKTDYAAPNSWQARPKKTRPEMAGMRAGAKKAAPDIAAMLRVDHAGEYGAVAIYRGQQAVFGKSRKTQAIAAQIAEMEAEEQKHLTAFDDMLIARRVRPTALGPIWRAAGYGLGVATALMGEKAAHACTEAVESVIEQHYAEQIEATRESAPELCAVFTEFREDELHHRDIAVEGGAKEAAGYGILSRVITAGCQAAIKITERI